MMFRDRTRNFLVAIVAALAAVSGGSNASYATEIRATAQPDPIRFSLATGITESLSIESVLSDLEFRLSTNGPIDAAALHWLDKQSVSPNSDEFRRLFTAKVRSCVQEGSAQIATETERKLATRYAQRFSIEELEELSAFAATDAGRNVLRFQLGNDFLVRRDYLESTQGFLIAEYPDILSETRTSYRLMQEVNERR